MKKRLLFILIVLLSSLSAFTASLSFSGGKSSLSLRDGKEEVVLSDNAVVILDDMTLKSDGITLSGDNWRYVDCTGLTTVNDESRGLEIKASGIWYDRVAEFLAINSWFEIEDKQNQLFTMGGAMYFDMNAETLELSEQVTLIKVTDSGLMRCSAESIIYDRKNETLSLMSDATVIWNDDTYSAEIISVDLSTDTISLEGRIKGSINE